MPIRRSDSRADRAVVALANVLASLFLFVLAVGSLTSCGSGGGGGGRGSGSGPVSENPADAGRLDPSPEAGALLLDIEELVPLGDAVVVQGTVARFAVKLGPEHRSEAVSYFWTLDGNELAANNSELLLATEGLAFGTHVVKVTMQEGEASDESGRVAWRLQVVREGSIRDRAPAILQALPPGDVNLLQGSEIQLSILATDVESEADLKYHWTLDEARVETDGPSIIVDSARLEPGTHTATVRVLDGTERTLLETPAFSWKLFVDQESAYTQPYLSGAWPQGNPRISDQGRLRFEVAAVVSDPEDTVAYHWEVNGIPQEATGSFFHLVPPDDESRQDVSDYRVTCRLLDDREDSQDAAAVGWTVERGPLRIHDALGSEPRVNSAPRIRLAYPEQPVKAMGNESSYFHVAASDADGDVLTYQWYLDGVRLPVAGPVFTYNRGLQRQPGQHRLQVIVTDGRDSRGEVITDSSLWDLEVVPTRPLALTLAAGALVIDNGKSGTSFTNDWTTSSAPGAYGSNSLYSKSLSGTYTYTFTVPSPGRYEVVLWWTNWDGRHSAVPVTIAHAQGTASITVNQSSGGGRWNSLGTYDFSTEARVTIRSVSSTFSTCADAAALNPVGTSPLPPPPSTGLAGEIVIDDGSSGTSSVGTWTASSAPGPYGGRSLFAKSTGSYTFQRSLPEAGAYDVYAWWTDWSSRSSSAPFVIDHASGSATVNVNQQANGGKWNLLGRYNFGSTARVTLRVTSTATFCADAVRIVPAGTAPPADDGGTNDGDIVLDAGGPGTLADGAWASSSAPNAYGGGSLYAKDRGSYAYNFKLPAAGKYGVHAWYTEWSSRESQVPYEIQHSGGVATVRLDQRTGGGRWQPLGDFDFGTTARVTIRVVDSNTVCADAIRFVPGGGAGEPVEPPPPAPAPGTSAKITELAAFPLTPTLARVSWKSSFLGDSVVTFGGSSSASDSTRTVTGSRWDHSVLLEPLQSDKVYYVKVRTAGGGASASSEVVSFRTPDSTPAFTVSSDHPRIYFNAAELPSVRSRIKTEPYATWWGKVITYCNQQVGKSVTEIRNDFPRANTTLAFGGLIGNVASYRDKAIAVAMSIAGLGNTGDNKIVRDRIDAVVPVYDWLYDYLTSAQRTTLRSKLASYAATLENQVVASEYADGHSNGNQNGAFLAALAIYGEDSSAAGIVSRALTRYNDGFWAFWREHASENGGSFKSGWYTTVATQFNFEVFAAWKSATGKNLFQVERVWFERLADWYIHSLRGDLSWDRHGDVVFQLGVDEIERHLLIQIAREFKNTDAQWLANKIRNFLPLWGPDLVLDILWYDASVAAKTPTQPTSRHFKGSGMVFARESWSDNSVKAMFRAVPYYMGGHGHLDQCSFAIFYKEGLALDSGLYDDYSSSHHLSYYSRTIAHNAILVTDPAEVFKLYGNTQPPDGGQYWLDASRIPHPFPEHVKDLTHDDSFSLGGIKAYEDTSLYTYALGDGTLAYNPNKMAVYNRHFLWVKSLSGWSHPVIFIFDEIEAKKSTFQKTYLLHTTNKPVVSGSLIHATSGSGRLYQRTVFPASASITLVGGAGREYWVNGRNYPPSRGPKSGEEPGAWRVEVSPTADRLHDEFLHVLYPTESSTGTPPSVRSIDAATMKGCEAQGLVVLFAVKRGSVPSVSYSLTGSRRNVLFGLSAALGFDILIDGVKQSTVTSTVTGVLDFTNARAGKVEVIRK